MRSDHKAALEAADEKCRAQAEEHAAAVAALEAKCGAMQQDYSVASRYMRMLF